MQGNATIGGQPIHPMLVTIPIGCYVAAVASDIISIWAGPAFWPQMATWLIAFGTIGALAAAVPGLIDYLTVPLSSAGRNVAGWHMMLNGAVIIIFGAAFALRVGHYNMGLGYFLTGLGIVTVVVSGALGGRIAHRHMGGTSEADVAAPRRAAQGEIASDQRAASSRRGVL